jgi:hypothetical protein
MRVFDWGGKKRKFDSVAFDPTGRFLAAGGNYEPTIVWDAMSGAEQCRFQPAQGELGFRFHPVSGRLLIPTYSGLRVCDPSGQEASALLGPGVGRIAIDPGDGWAVYEGEGNRSRRTLAATRELGSGQPNLLWTAFIGDLEDEAGYTMGLALLPGGEHFASCEYVSGPGYRNSRYRVAIRSRADGRIAQTTGTLRVGYGDRLFAAPVCPAVIVHAGIWLRVWASDDVTGPCVRELRNDGRKHFTDLAFHPTGRFLAATSNDHTVKLFDTTTWEVVRTFTWEIGKMRSIAFSADGTLAAAGSDTGKVVVWDVDV